MAALRADDWAGFINLRAKRMASLERQFMQKIGVSASTTIIGADAIDTE